MIGVIMAGGRGTRMGMGCEKLLLRYKKPAILHVVDSLRDSGRFSKILTVTSPHSPNTKKLLQENNVETLDTPGAGYSEDLNAALGTINDSALVVSGDLPLLDGKIIRQVISCCSPENIWTSVLVTGGFLESVGMTSEYSVNFNGQKCHYTGVSAVGAERISSLENCPEDHVIIDDRRIALNLNTRRDYELLCTA